MTAPQRDRFVLQFIPSTRTFYLSRGDTSIASLLFTTRVDKKGRKWSIDKANRRGQTFDIRMSIHLRCVKSQIFPIAKPRSIIHTGDRRHRIHEIDNAAIQQTNQESATTSKKEQQNWTYRLSTEQKTERVSSRNIRACILCGIP